VKQMTSCKAITFLTIVAFSSAIGCAKSPDRISPAYCSPAMYQSYNCQQIEQEIHRVNHHLQEICGKQRAEAGKDAAAMAVGMVVFWPALFFLIGDDKKDEIARLKGEYEALETVAIQKECSISEELKKAREEAEQKKKEQMAEEENILNQLP